MGSFFCLTLHKIHVMEKIVLKESLESFLIANGAYDSFVSNLVQQALCLPTLIDDINHHFGGGCFSGAFYWDSTPEGHDYWYELAEKFELVDEREDGF